MASSWGTSWGTSWADSWGTTGSPPVVVVTPSAVVRRGAPRTAERLYLPPGKYTKKRKQRAVEAVKELYEEAKREIPKPLQHSLIPSELLLRQRNQTALLPPISAIDFEALAGSLDTIQVLVAAIDAQRRRRKEEETLLMLLMDVL